MARPRKYIRIGGQTIDGVSLHRPSGRYYVLKGDERVYFDDWREASAEYEAHTQPPLPPLEQSRLQAVASVRYTAAMERLKGLGETSRADDLLFEGVAESILAEGEPAVARLRRKMNLLADEVGVPAYAIQETPVDRRSHPSTNPKLKELVERWMEGKLNERGASYVPRTRRMKLKRSPLNQHELNTLKRWDLFTRQVGNVRVADLAAEHFRRFFAWAVTGQVKTGQRWAGQNRPGLLVVV